MRYKINEGNSFKLHKHSFILLLSKHLIKLNFLTKIIINIYIIYSDHNYNIRILNSVMIQIKFLKIKNFVKQYRYLYYTNNSDNKYFSKIYLKKYIFNTFDLQMAHIVNGLGNVLDLIHYGMHILFFIYLMKLLTTVSSVYFTLKYSIFIFRK